MDSEDPISPVRITHGCDQLWRGDRLEQRYNFLDYEFETEAHRYRARAYLDDIQTVSIFGPFEKATTILTAAVGVEIDHRVLAYLRRRYAVIKKPSPDGYVPVP